MPYNRCGEIQPHIADLRPRRNSSSRGFQNISRRLRGSLPQNHTHTLLCLSCNQLTNPKEKSAPRKPNFSKWPSKAVSVKSLYFPHCLGLKEQPSAGQRENRQSQVKKFPENTVGTSVLPDLHSFTSSLEGWGRLFWKTA